MRIASDPNYTGYNLPAPLEMALRKFAKWSDEQLLQEQRAVTPVAPLYHYTGQEALKGILENRHLWCFSHAQQDDVDEFMYSLNIAQAELKHIAMYGDEFAKEFCRCVRDLITKNDLTKLFNFYLFSVSMKSGLRAAMEGVRTRLHGLFNRLCTETIPRGSADP